MEQRPGLNGTARYASINAHQGRGQSRRDDLESLGYMLVYLATGSVPWQGLKNSETKNDDIAAVKINTPIPEFCSGFPAAEAIAEHLTYARGLEYEERPDYPFLFGLYTSILEQVPGPYCITQKQGKFCDISVLIMHVDNVVLR